MRSARALVTALAFIAPASAAPAFEISFTWDGLPLCTTGNAKRVASPAFSVSDAPEGTTFLRFKLVDKNVPGFDHGGGTVAYDGSGSVPAGAFKYYQPCPPGQVHTYEWSATAQSKKNGGKLGTAKSTRTYPE